MSEAGVEQSSLRLFDLYSGGQVVIRDRIIDLILKHNCPDLKSPLFNIARELVTNGLKAIYKKLFYETVVVNLGLHDIEYKDWLHLFKTEIESHNAKNLGHQARLLDSAVEIVFEDNDEFIRLTISNPGIPTEVERKRLENSLKKAAELEDFTYLLTEKEEDPFMEGAGIGLPLVVMTLKGIGADPDLLKYTFEKGQTTVSITLFLADFPRVSQPAVQIIATDQLVADNMKALVTRLDMAVLVFDKNGVLLECSPNFFELTGIDACQPALFRRMMPKRFFEDVFYGPRSAVSRKRIENYRLTISNHKTNKSILFNISGVLQPNGTVVTLWQKVVADAKIELSEGLMYDNIALQQITRRYLPVNVLDKAREAVMAGDKTIANESRNITALFGDLSSLSEITGYTDSSEFLSQLNSSLSLIARTISKHGGMFDKFMGDAFIVLFDQPLNAVAAAVELQNIFGLLNEFRSSNEEAPIELGLGLHSGMIIMGTVITNQRMEWTAFGDVISTAASIERHANSGQVLISEVTFKQVEEHITVHESFEISVGTKRKRRLNIFAVKSVVFDMNGHSKKIETGGSHG